MKKVLDYKFVPATHEAAKPIINLFGYQNLKDMQYQLRGDLSDYNIWSELTLPISRFELDEDCQNDLFDSLPSDLNLKTVFIYGSPDQRVLVCTIQMFLSELGIYSEEEIQAACNKAGIGYGFLEDEIIKASK